MTDKTPPSKDHSEPQLDTSGDTEAPAFDWMRTGGATKAPQNAASGDNTKQSKPAAEDVPGVRERTATPQRASEPAAGAVPGTTQLPKTAPASGTRADRRAAEAGNSGVVSRDITASAVFAEPFPTSGLQVRPPEAEVERRNKEREDAANSKPVLPRVMQVLLAVFFPVILLIAAIRAVASPLFLWVEYNRPGFPGDGYGFSTDDRMTYGSYAVDYLNNWAGPRFLGDLVGRNGEPLFKEGEVSHMADVKTVIMTTFGAGVVLAIIAIIAIIYLRRRRPGGVRRGLFTGSLATLVLMGGLGTLAFLGWEQFFTEFHRIFFANGTWTFTLEDTLIRLFPGQFWIDAGIVIGGLVVVVALITLVLTWPTKKRRGRARDRQELVAADDAEKLAGQERDLSTAKSTP
ncbi:TIGR01906 family membrane protein [Pseudarthrobacter sp. PS3-L1]|uniref:TIGR01906 family membrane protein n=1 Tax=Pseudarthrobacter sp. PS3-L1 TaxID=3046207 RepID=UPI0024B9F8E4|nr:TIGR01906 family membrane protein [Pseudarthrobacter sp. PS3-L1]MDJ0319646.1 TIGR01906 family membrane protein [Pseudarthrobacter sp. PS3-L1]